MKFIYLLTRSKLVSNNAASHQSLPVRQYQYQYRETRLPPPPNHTSTRPRTHKNAFIGQGAINIVIFLDSIVIYRTLHNYLSHTAITTLHRLQYRLIILCCSEKFNLLLELHRPGVGLVGVSLLWCNSPLLV